MPRRSSNPHTDPELETFIHQELRRLPDRQTPAGFVDAVLERVSQKAALPWWKRSWWHWPLAARMAGLAVFVLSAVALTAGAFSIDTTLSSLLGWAGERWDAAERIFAAGAAVMEAFNLSANALANHPAAWGGFALCLLAYLAFIGAGSLLARVAMQRAQGVRT